MLHEKQALFLSPSTEAAPSMAVGSTTVERRAAAVHHAAGSGPGFTFQDFHTNTAALFSSFPKVRYLCTR